MSLPILEVSKILATLQLPCWTKNAQVVLELSVLAWSSIVEMSFVLIFIAIFDLSHVIKSAIPNSPGFRDSFLSHS